MDNWVIRRVADGLFWSGDGWREHVRDAFVWSQVDHDADAGKDPLSRLCNESEEWVELDDAGQPVEAAKPVRKWVVRRIIDRMFFSRLRGGSWVKCVDDALVYEEAGEFGACGTRGDREWVPVLVHPDGTVTLDEPAPAVAQPSPYSDSPDAPIPYTVTDPVEALCDLVAQRERVNTRRARLSRRAIRLDEEIDAAKARLRGAT